jgi:hypothetical protein
MDSEPGTRGIVLGDRYRVAGALRRTGLIDAVDLEADRAQAACRIVGVPGDAERVDAWEDAWRAAQDSARLPRLREVIIDADGAHWAVLEVSQATAAPLDGDLRGQALDLGEALARSGLDVTDVSRSRLAVDPAGALLIDGPVWLGGDVPPRAAGRRLADLLPPAPTGSTAARGDDDDLAPPPLRRHGAGRGRARHRRLLLPAAILLLAATAAALFVLPVGSASTGELAPAAPTEPGAALLIGQVDPLVEPATVQPLPGSAAPSSPAASGDVAPPAPPPAEPVVTVTIEAPVVAAETPVVASDVPALPEAAAVGVPALPLDAPALPLDVGG